MTDTADDDAPGPAPTRPPWELHPALSEDRLRVCARLLANARRDALALASHALGDDPWSVGCRAYAFGRHRLRRAAEAGLHNWLGVLDDSTHFVFLIEDVPVRFYRGPADEPTERALRRHAEEARQLSLALGGDAAAGLVFRFALETGEGGRVERVVFLALRGEEGRAECVWPVPLDAAGMGPEGVGSQLRLLPDDGYAGPRGHAADGPCAFSAAVGGPARDAPARGASARRRAASAPRGR